MKIVEEAWRRFFRENGWQRTDKLLLPGILRSGRSTMGPCPHPWQC